MFELVGSRKPSSRRGLRRVGLSIGSRLVVCSHASGKQGSEQLGSGFRWHQRPGAWARPSLTDHARRGEGSRGPGVVGPRLSSPPGGPRPQCLWQLPKERVRSREAWTCTKHSGAGATDVVLVGTASEPGVCLARACRCGCGPEPGASGLEGPQQRVSATRGPGAGGWRGWGVPASCREPQGVGGEAGNGGVGLPVTRRSREASPCRAAHATRVHTCGPVRLRRCPEPWGAAGGTWAHPPGAAALSLPLGLFRLRSSRRGLRL